MSDIEERKFYLQLWAFTTGPAIDAMHMYFEINVLNKTKLETFLNNANNKHVLFHQCFPEMSCCECNIHSIASKGKKGCLNKQQLKILFDDTNLPQPNHEKMVGTQTTQDCLCKYSAKCSINIDSLDITLFYAIVQHCCPSTMNFAWRKSVKDVRNFLAHVGNGHVTKSDFQTHWLSLEIATYGFAEELGNKCLKMFKKDVSHIKSSSIEGLQITLKETRDQLCKTLNHLNGFKPLYTDVAESKTILQSMQTQQSEQNMKVDNKLEQMNSLLLGIIANQRIDKLKSSVSVYDSEESIHTDAIKNTSSSSVSLQCTITSSVLDEDKALKQITKDENEKDEKQFEVKSAEKKCLLLHLQSSREIFRSVESLWYAINSLLERIVKAGDIDTSVESTMSIKLALTSPVTDEERNVIRAMLSKYGGLNEKYLAIKTEYVLKSITPSFFKVQTKGANRTDSTPFKRVRMEMDEEKYDQSGFTDKDDFALNQQVKMETTNEVKYEEIFVNIENMKCLLKLNGLPNDLDQPESEEVSPDTEGNQLLYLEWTFECPGEWNLPLIVSSINDNISTFPDEFPVDFVYNETSRTFILHTTAQRSSFRSYSSLEAAVVKLIGKIINVSSIASTEPAELSASVLIMTKPEEGDFIDDKKAVKEEIDNISITSEDNNTRCNFCTKVFECYKCTAKIEHIRTLSRANRMKEQTISRLFEILSRKEKDMKKVASKEGPDQKKRKTVETKLEQSTDGTFYGNISKKCGQCNTEEEYQISCYCDNCMVYYCDACIIEHRLANREHTYFYRYDILRGYELKQSWELAMPVAVDITCLHHDAIVTLQADFEKSMFLVIYNSLGALINMHNISNKDMKSRIACINSFKVAVTMPSFHMIYIVTCIHAQCTTVTLKLTTPLNATMTGGITQRLNILYVCYSDAIRLFNLTGQVLSIINIPCVNILQSFNIYKMLYVYPKDILQKTIAFFDLSNGAVSDLKRFPFQPDDITIDEIGNIIFLAEGVIWRADSDGQIIEVIVSPDINYDRIQMLSYDKSSRTLVTSERGSLKLYRKVNR